MAALTQVYRCEKELHKDRTGVVYQVTDSSKTFYAAKSSYSSVGRWSVKEYLRTIRRLGIKHDYIVTCLDKFSDPQRGACNLGACLLLDYMPFGTLGSLNSINLQDLKGILQQSLQALQYLHDEKGLTHGNITPNNILVQSVAPILKIKLGDVVLPMQDMVLFSQTFNGIPKYDAPGEAITPPADIWELAAAMCVAIDHEPMYSKHLRREDWAKRWLDEIQCEAEGAYGSMVPLLKQMLSINPSHRPSAGKCLSDLSLQRNTSPGTNTMNLDSGISSRWPRNFTFDVPPHPKPPSPQAFTEKSESWSVNMWTGEPSKKKVRFSCTPSPVKNPPRRTIESTKNLKPADINLSNVSHPSRSKREVLRLKIAPSRLAHMDDYQMTQAKTDRDEGDKSPQFAPRPSDAELEKLRLDVCKLRVSSGGDDGSQMRKRRRSPIVAQASCDSSFADDEMC